MAIEEEGCGGLEKDNKPVCERKEKEIVWQNWKRIVWQNSKKKPPHIYLHSILLPAHHCEGVHLFLRLGKSFIGCITITPHPNKLSTAQTKGWGEEQREREGWFLFWEVRKRGERERERERKRERERENLWTPDTRYHCQKRNIAKHSTKKKRREWGQIFIETPHRDLPIKRSDPTEHTTMITMSSGYEQSIVPR